MDRLPRFVAMEQRNRVKSAMMGTRGTQIPVWMDRVVSAG